MVRYMKNTIIGFCILFIGLNTFAQSATNCNIVESLLCDDLKETGYSILVDSSFSIFTGDTCELCWNIVKGKEYEIIEIPCDTAFYNHKLTDINLFIYLDNERFLEDINPTSISGIHFIAPSSQMMRARAIGTIYKNNENKRISTDIIIVIAEKPTSHPEEVSMTHLERLCLWQSKHDCDSIARRIGFFKSVASDERSFRYTNMDQRDIFINKREKVVTYAIDLLDNPLGYERLKEELDVVGSYKFDSLSKGNIYYSNSRFEVEIRTELRTVYLFNVFLKPRRHQILK